MSLRASMRRDRSAKRLTVWDDIVYSADGNRKNDDYVIVYAASATGVAAFWVLAFIAVCVVKAADPATCFFPSSSRRRNLYTPENREARFTATVDSLNIINRRRSFVKRFDRSRDNYAAEAAFNRR